MNVTKALVKKILEKPDLYDWSLQGFGMLRLYLSKEIRLHIWSSRLQYVPKPDAIHDHPWDFESTVIVGGLLNVRYAISPDASNLNYKRHQIKCGPGGMSEPGHTLVHLFADKVEVIEAGDGYSQRAEEIHESIPSEGSVSVITRRFLADTEHAHVFTPRGLKWKSAEPRRALLQEVVETCNATLERWF